jgi:hypothetical protein
MKSSVNLISASDIKSFTLAQFHDILVAAASSTRSETQLFEKFANNFAPRR